MGNTPVFSKDDQVPPNLPGLPPELQGKSAADVVKYFQERERTAAEDFRARLAAAATPAPPPPKEPEGQDFWKDPKKAVDATIAAKTVSREEFQRASGAVQGNMIEMAEFLVSQKFADWKLYKPMIDEIVKGLDPWTKTDKNIWESAYYYSKGRNPVTVTPSADAGKPTPTSVIVPAAERGAAAPPNPGAVPVVLNEHELWVANHLNITPEEYTKAKVDMNKEGSLPFTYDNRRTVGATR